MIKELNTEIPNKIIVDILENLLNEAERGQIQSIAVAGVYTKQETFNVFEGRYKPVELLGEIRLLERDVIDLCCDTRRQVDWDFVE